MMIAWVCANFHSLIPENERKRNCPWLQYISNSVDYGTAGGRCYCFIRWRQFSSDCSAINVCKNAQNQTSSLFHLSVEPLYFSWNRIIWSDSQGGGFLMGREDQYQVRHNGCTYLCCSRQTEIMPSLYLHRNMPAKTHLDQCILPANYLLQQCCAQNVSNIKGCIMQCAGVSL